MKTIVLSLLAACLLTNAQAQESISLSWQDCRESALAHNEDLQRADNAVRQAELDKEIALAAYLPKADGMAMGTYLSDMDMMGMTLQMRGAYLAGINLTQPIYTGGRIRAGQKLAQIGREAQQENQRKTRMQVIADAANAYWSYIAVSAKVRMLDAYKAQMDTLYQQAETSLAAGMATGNDLLRIRTRQSDIHYQWQKARNGKNLCRLALCHAIGCPLETEILPTDTVIPIEAPSSLDTDISARPELALLQKQIEAAEEQVKMTRAAMLPTVALSAGYIYYGNIKLNGFTQDAEGTPQPFTSKFDDGIWQAMATVSIPLCHWGENLKKVRKSKLDVANARLDLEKNTRLLHIETRQASQNLLDGYRLLKTATLGSQTADENLHIMHNRYLNGMSTLTDLLDAQSQWQQARSNLIDAQTQYKIYETEYLRVTGKLE